MSSRIRWLWGFPGWGWRMYGVASFRAGRMWFIGFSKQEVRHGKETKPADPPA